MKYTALTALMALSLAFAPTASADDDIVDTAVKAGQFETLVAAVKAAGLVDTLKSNGPFTVFAPTDEAFAKLPKGTIRKLLKPENRDQLVAILTYHVVPGKVTARDAFGLTTAPTVNGQQLSVSATPSGISIGGANVVAADIECSNGVIHVIDSVLLPSTINIPETAAKAGTFKTLLAAATAAGLVDALSSEGPLTVFAPTDEAFAALPEGTVESLLKKENKDQLAAILKYHVVSGRVFAADAVKAQKATTLQGQDVSVSYGADGVTINDSKVITSDIQTSNGVIHVIDAVLLPKKLSAREARRMIEHAIVDGSQRYNDHDHAGCADVYMSTMMRIMSDRPSTICSTEAAHLMTALEKSRRTHDMDDRAWLLRHALETTHHALAN